MSRFSFLAALVFALVSVASAESNATVESFASLAAPAATWVQLTDAAAWSPRIAGVVEFYKPEGTATGKFLMYGVGFWGSQNAAIGNEVWQSTNGRNWNEVVYTGTGNSKSFNPALFGSIYLQGQDSSQYVIQGSNYAWTDSSEVWISTNGAKTWQQQTASSSSRQLPGPRALGGAVSLPSSPKTIVVFGGQSGDAASGNILSDVWLSSDAGKNWARQTASAQFGPRAVNQGLVTTLGNTDVIYTVMGYVDGDIKTGTAIYENDIWISTDKGRKWSQITDKAPWLARGDGQAEFTDNGVMIITGGIGNYVSGENDIVLNDVWASLDGGYSWGLCVEDAPFSNRQFPYTVLDDKGYLYMMGGRGDTTGEVNDVWKSTFSFSDINKVADNCNLLIPSCGAGLKCLPSSAGFRAGLWGVTCDACPNSPTLNPTGPTTSTSTSGMVSTTVLVVFIVLFIITLLLLAYTFYKLREAGAASPIPLPASAQRWWNKNSSDGLIGGSTGSSLPDSTGDSLYNPLTIRDGM